MERDTTPHGIKPENEQFLSPVLELTKSLQSLSTTRGRRTPRRKLSLSNVRPSPARSSMAHCDVSASGAMDSSGSETDSSPFLRERLLCKKKGGVKTLDMFPVVKDYRRPSSPALRLDGSCYSKLGCLDEEFESESVQQQAQQDIGRHQTQFVVPQSQHKTDQVLGEETKLHPQSLLCKRNLMSHPHTLRSRLPSQRDGVNLPANDSIGAAFTQPFVSKISSSESQISLDSEYCTISSFSCTTSMSYPITFSGSNGRMQKVNSRPKRRSSQFLEDQENVNPADVTAASLSVGFDKPDSVCQSPASKKLCSKETDSTIKRKSGSDEEQADKYSSLISQMTAVSQRYGNSKTSSDVTVKLALNQSDDRLHELIGDFSRPYSLPFIENDKHRDLKTISCHTLSRVLNNDFTDTINKCIIVDGRYPYEYDAGHIQSSVNIYTKEDIFSQFITSSEFHLCTESSCHQILVFHCEFSSQRGPRLMHFVRSKDREAHSDSYPVLYYPEMYLLDGGYKAFFESYPELCEPSFYKPMLHSDHLEDLKYFRAKTKSWSRDKNRHSKSSQREASKIRSGRLRSCCRLP